MQTNPVRYFLFLLQWGEGKTRGLRKTKEGNDKQERRDCRTTVRASTVYSQLLRLKLKSPTERAEKKTLMDSIYHVQVYTARKSFGAQGCHLVAVSTGRSHVWLYMLELTTVT
jgi:hypothetical protein